MREPGVRVVLGGLVAAGIFVALVVGGAVKDVLKDILKQELQGWIEVLPFTVLQLARRRLPAKRREDLYEEWSAELAVLLRERAEGRPITRLVLGIRYAAGHLATGRRTACELGPHVREIGARGRRWGQWLAEGDSYTDLDGRTWMVHFISAVGPSPVELVNGASAAQLLRGVPLTVHRSLSRKLGDSAHVTVTLPGRCGGHIKVRLERLRR
jgi:hypothetical protein